jgi:hypothetical protein
MYRKLVTIFLVVLNASCDLAPGSSGQFTPEKPKLSDDLLSNMTVLGDVLRSDNPDIYKLLEGENLTAVTKEFGPTVINTQDFPFRSELAVSKVIPWSSWWYPKKEDALFTDSNGRYSSALTKYDRVRSKTFKEEGRSQSSDTAAAYEKRLYNPNAVSWEGLCDAWSLASISKPEPKRPVSIKNITFQVSDLKALLLKTYEAVDDTSLKFYGQKFTGDANGWIYPDIFPDQFHRFLEIQLFQNRQPFIMDHDAGLEVWNTPVFKANYLMDRIPSNPNAVFVRTWLYTAEPTQSQDREFVGTKETVREYNYVLVGTRMSDGSLLINSGYWVKGPDGVDSRRDHPDYLIYIPNPEAVIRKSWNPEIDINLVDRILQQAY